MLNCFVAEVLQRVNNSCEVINGVCKTVLDISTAVILMGSTAAASACQHNLESDIPLSVYPFIHPSIHLRSLRVEGVLESITAVLGQRQFHCRANTKSCQLAKCACFWVICVFGPKTKRRTSRHNTEGLRLKASGCEVTVITISNFSHCVAAILSTFKLSFLFAPDLNLFIF